MHSDNAPLNPNSLPGERTCRRIFRYANEIDISPRWAPIHDLWAPLQGRFSCVVGVPGLRRLIQPLRPADQCLASSEPEGGTGVPNSGAKWRARSDSNLPFNLLKYQILGLEIWSKG